MKEDDLLLARDRIRRIFSFLQALDQHRNPVKRQLSEQPWSCSLAELPQHEAVDFKYPIDGYDYSGDQEGQTSRAEQDSSSLLRVRRPEITRPPTPPEEIQGWLEEHWEDPFREVRVRPKLVEKTGEGDEQLIVFDEDSERVERFQQWLRLREDWAKTERPARTTMRLFEKLYELHGRMRRESDEVELMIGDGILNWRLPDGGINHPTLLMRVELIFEPELPCFTLLESDLPAELYASLLRGVQGVDGKTISELRSEFDEGGYHPFEGHKLDAFLKSFVVRLSPHGEFLHDEKETGEKDHPRLWRDPVLFLRSRTLGFSAAINSILEHLEVSSDLPGPLTRIAGVETEEGSSAESNDTLKPWEEPADILLSREANSEQIQVIRRLQQSSSVVVQGPPGTGKTYTIANLIGHLLSQGKSVLVTSHTSRALRVLRDHVEPSLQPLCLSVLESDFQSRKQLEESIEQIVERLSASDAMELKREAEELTNLRKNLISEINDIRSKLQEGTKDEYRQIVIGGQSYDPSNAARKVAKEEKEHAWIPNPVLRGVPLPLSGAEIAELYGTNVSLGREEEKELLAGVPKSNQVPHPELISKLEQERQSLKDEDRTLGKFLWNRDPQEPDLGILRKTLQTVKRMEAELNSLEPWQKNLVEIGGRDCDGSETLHSRPWIALIERIRKFAAKVSQAEETYFRYGPVLPDDFSNAQSQEVAGAIIEHLRSGRSLGRISLMLHREWKRFVERAKVEGGTPTSEAHFEALQTLAVLNKDRNQLCQRWNRQAIKIGLPSAQEFDSPIDVVLQQLADRIEHYVTWHKSEWKELRSELDSVGFDWAAHEETLRLPVSKLPNLARANSILADLPRYLEARLFMIRWLQLEDSRQKLKQTFDQLETGVRGSEITSQLVIAGAELKANAYFTAWKQLAHLDKKRSILERREKLLKKLELDAKNWAKEISMRRGLHGNGEVPGDPIKAWTYRQISDELERRNRMPVEELERDLQKKTRRLRKVTASLIEKKTWAGQLHRTGLAERQALMGWRDIVNRTPKTSRVPGKLARLRREAQLAMKRCRATVPVWIMPTTRVVDTFDFKNTRFDVVIIDEASQTDVMGLLMYFLARKVVVVGDHEQVSPSAVGQKDEIVHNLIDEHLTGIPNAILYDGKTSIYDLARQASGEVLCLLEHFRSLPQIIQFSNDLCYNGRIRPLRDDSTVRLKPSVIPYQVKVGSSVGKVNSAEAQVVASLVSACLERPEYFDLTFGIVSLVGEEQAYEIDSLLRDHLNPSKYEKHRILCGNAAHFQGDERHVVFLSMVDSPRDGPLPLRSQPQFRQRFNVSASRAKDQLWVVYSVDHRVDLKPGDLRRRLIEHALDPQALVRKLDRVGRRTESEFERLVAERLVREGYIVKPQWHVGYYRIDLVIEGSGQRLAVECDGDRYHPLEKLADDMARQATLERLGWKFVRIRGTKFFRNPDAALEPLFETLERLKISPEANQGTSEGGTSHSDSELRDWVVRRASEIRRNWTGETSDHTDEPSSGTLSSQQQSDESKKSKDGEVTQSSQTSTVQSSSKAGTNSKGKIIRYPRVEPEVPEREGVGAESQPRTSRKDVECLPVTDANVWLALSHWAKENDQFKGWERSLLYSVGRYLRREWRISEKQAHHANRLYSTALECGFNPERNVRKDAEGRREDAQGYASEEDNVASESPKIDQLPQEDIRDAIFRYIPEEGRIRRDKLLQEARRTLGFQKLGRKVRRKLNRTIGALVRTGHIETDWEWIWKPDGRQNRSERATGDPI